MAAWEDGTRGGEGRQPKPHPLRGGNASESYRLTHGKIPPREPGGQEAQSDGPNSNDKWQWRTDYDRGMQMWENLQKQPRPQDSPGQEKVFGGR